MYTKFWAMQKKNQTLDRSNTFNICPCLNANPPTIIILADCQFQPLKHKTSIPNLQLLGVPLSRNIIYTVNFNFDQSHLLAHLKILTTC